MNVLEKALIYSLILTFVLKALSEKTGILLEQPSERKIHTNPVPLVGGTVIFLTFAISGKLNLGLILAFLVGIIDDIFEIPYYAKFALQFVVSTYFIMNNSSYLTGIYVIDKVLLFFWFLALFNAFNLVDGMNGLLVGIGIFYSLVLGDPFIFLILLPIYIFNLSGKVFLGDSGAFLLAYYFIDKTILKGFDLITLTIFFGYLSYEVASSFLRRIIIGKNPFKPDLYHIHHIGMKKFNSVWTLLIIYSLNLGFTLLSFGSSKWLKVIIFLSVCGVIFTFQIFESRVESSDSDFKL